MKHIFSRKFAGFTMAEILLSLTIIGVVAAITLPSLTGNINERTWATQKKALYARMSQAFPLMDSVNTYDSAADFLASGLSKVSKINNICDADHIADCGINTDLLTTITGGTMSDGFPQTWSALGINVSYSYTAPEGATAEEAASGRENAQKDADKALVAAFETGNGESIVAFYNPNCGGDNENAANVTEDLFNYVCVNMVYDLNSSSGPNTVGKDVGFMTVFYPYDPVVTSVVPYTSTTSSTACPTDYRTPSKYEGASMALNYKLISGTDTEMFTASKGSNGTDMYSYKVKFNRGKLTSTASKISGDTNASGTTRCVKR